MNNFSAVLSRTLTTEFYRVNAMFFLVVMGFCFGFMRGAEHIALAGFFVSSIWLVMIPIGVWMIYTFKVIFYNKREVRFERNTFLYSLPLTNAWSAYFTVAIGQLAPAIGYGLFLVAMSLKPGRWTELSSIAFSLLVMIVVTTWYLHRSLVYPHKERSTPQPIRKLDKLFAKPSVWMFTEGIVRSQPGMIYVTKFAACIVIYGATHLYLFDQYDERLYLMAACAGFSANLALVFQYQKFEVTELAILRSLPISFVRRLISFVMTMILLCFPEIIILFTNLPGYLGIIHYINAIVFGFSLLIAGYGSLYVRVVDFDSFTRTIFFTSMTALATILFGVPVSISAAVLLIAGVVLLKTKFYSYQP